MTSSARRSSDLNGPTNNRAPGPEPDGVFDFRLRTQNSRLRDPVTHATERPKFGAPQCLRPDRRSWDDFDYSLLPPEYEVLQQCVSTSSVTTQAQLRAKLVKSLHTAGKTKA